MNEFLSTLVHDYGWVHLSCSLIGNTTFLVGSVFFLPAFEPWKVVGVWLFIIGAFLMTVGSLGRLLVDTLEPNPGSTKSTPARNARGT